MAERTALQKQSLSAHLLFVQFFRSGQSPDRLVLRRQTGRSPEKNIRESKHHYDSSSYFQDRFTFALQSSFACVAVSGRTFCTATSSWCQEIRYGISLGIFHYIAKCCEKMNHQINIRIIISFTNCMESGAVYFWKAGSGKLL